MSRKGPSSIDLHVSAKLRRRREALQLTQTTVARAVGVSPAQIQKYERGKDRISAGRLYELAVILECGIGFFYDGLDDS